MLLDNVQYRRRYFQNRNKIRTSSGWTWLTVPVHSEWGKSLISDVTIDNGGDWQQSCLASLRHHYSRAPYYRAHAPFFESIYSRPWSNLIDLNCEIIRYLLNSFRLDTELRFASELSSSGKASDIILSLCKAIGATVYLSGVSGRDYLNLVDFDEANIQVRFQEFFHPIYRQCYEPFEPCMSSIDLLFNCGPDAHRILFGSDVPRLDYVIQ